MSEAVSAALVGNQFSRNPLKISFLVKTKSVINYLSWLKIYKASKPFCLSNYVSVARVVAIFPKTSLPLPAGQQRLLPTKKRNVFELARPTSLSCAAAQPKELGHWFCSQNLWLTSGIAFGNDYQMFCGGLNLDSNLNYASLPTSCWGFICSEFPE